MCGDGEGNPSELQYPLGGVLGAVCMSKWLESEGDIFEGITSMLLVVVKGIKYPGSRALLLLH